MVAIAASSRATVDVQDLVDALLGAGRRGVEKLLDDGDLVAVAQRAGASDQQQPFADTGWGLGVVERGADDGVPVADVPVAGGDHGDLTAGRGDTPTAGQHRRA